MASPFPHVLANSYSASRAESVLLLSSASRCISTGSPVRAATPAEKASAMVTPTVAAASTGRGPSAPKAGPAINSAAGAPRPEAVNIALSTFGRTAAGGRRVISE